MNRHLDISRPKWPGIPGRYGQNTLLYHLFADIDDPSDLSDPEKLGGFYIPDLLWIAGVGSMVGPTLSAVGTPTSGYSSFKLKDGTDVVTEEYLASPASGRKTTTPFNPGSNDVVVYAKMRIDSPNTVGVHYLCGTRDNALGNIGWIIYCTGTSMSILVRDNLGVQKSISIPNTHIEKGIVDIFAVIDRDGNTQIWVDDIPSSAVATPGGSIDSPDGFAINGKIGGGFYGDLGVLFVCVWYRSVDFYLADSGRKRKELTARFSGYWPIAKATDEIPDFNRLSPSSWQDHNDRWHIGGLDVPRTSGAGLVIGPARTNQAYRNLNPTDVSALTWTGAKSPTVVDDSAAISANDCDRWGDNVYEYTNDTGSTQHIRMSDPTGDTNDRSMQCLARVTAGAGTVKLGLYDESLGTFSGSAIHNGYDERTIINGQTPEDSDCTLCLEVPDSTTVRWIAHDMQTGSVCTTPIPNHDTSNPVTRNADTLDLIVPDDGGGRIEITIEPLGWSGSDAGDVLVVDRKTGSGPLIAVDSGLWSTSDGTVVIRENTTPPVASTEQDVECSWITDATMSIAIDGSSAHFDYDGTLPGSNELRLEATGGEYLIKKIIVLKNGHLLPGSTLVVP